MRAGWQRNRGKGILIANHRQSPWRNPTATINFRSYLFSVVAAGANGPRTVPVRSASEVRSGQEKSAICAPDNPLRTGTVRGPKQRDVPTRLNRYLAGRCSRNESFRYTDSTPNRYLS